MSSRTPATPLISRLHGLGLRLYRVALLAAVAWLLYGDGRRWEPLTVERVRDFYPTAAELSAPDLQSGMQVVSDGEGTKIGLIAQTMPEAASIIGYSGPSNVLIAMDANGIVIGLRVLHSDDTAEHVAEVISERKFFAQFKQQKLGELKPKPVDAVTGATLTSSAMAEGVLRKLGRQGPSLRFPEAITLEEVQQLEPKAATLQSSTKWQGAFDVLDAQKAVIAVTTRTAPVTDNLIGYKGPTDTLVLLDPAGTTVRGIQLRKSYDTKRYVGYVTGDSYFLNLFKGMTLEKLSTLDFDAAKIEGVSGATETSWSVAEGLKRRAKAIMEESQPALRALKSIRWRWQDTGHVIVVVSAFLMAFTRLRGIAWLRSAHHALLVAYVGLMAGELLSQALFTGWAKHGTPWRSAPGLVLLGIVALLGPVLTRRQLYCHHICPHGALQQFLMKRVRWQWQAPKWLESLPMVLLGAVLFIATLGLGFNLSALEPFDAYVWHVAGVASIAIAVIGLLASLFTPMAYCRYGCPTGALFKLLRYAGDHDRWGRKELIATLVVAAVAVWRFTHGV